MICRAELPRRRIPPSRTGRRRRRSRDAPRSSASNIAGFASSRTAAPLPSPWCARHEPLPRSPRAWHQREVGDGPGRPTSTCALAARSRARGRDHEAAPAPVSWYLPSAPRTSSRRAIAGLGQGRLSAPRRSAPAIRAARYVRHRAAQRPATGTILDHELLGGSRGELLAGTRPARVDG